MNNLLNTNSITDLIKSFIFHFRIPLSVIPAVGIAMFFIFSIIKVELAKSSVEKEKMNIAKRMIEISFIMIIAYFLVFLAVVLFFDFA